MTEQKIPKKKGRPRKYPPLTDEQQLALNEKRKVWALNRKERDKPSIKYYNKHKLMWSPRPDLKALVLAWIQPIGEDEIVQTILVDKKDVNNITTQTLLDEYYKNKVQKHLFSGKKSPSLQSFKDDKNTQ